MTTTDEVLHAMSSWSQALRRCLDKLLVGLCKGLTWKDGIDAFPQSVVIRDKLDVGLCPVHCEPGSRISPYEAGNGWYMSLLVVHSRLDAP